jgi:hypothetical protein
MGTLQQREGECLTCGGHPVQEDEGSARHVRIKSPPLSALYLLE